MNRRAWRPRLDELVVQRRCESAGVFQVCQIGPRGWVYIMGLGGGSTIRRRSDLRPARRSELDKVRHVIQESAW